MHVPEYLRLKVKVGEVEGKREKWIIGKGVWGFTTKNIQICIYTNLYFW